MKDISCFIRQVMSKQSRTAVMAIKACLGANGTYALRAIDWRSWPGRDVTLNCLLSTRHSFVAIVGKMTLKASKYRTSDLISYSLLNESAIQSLLSAFQWLRVSSLISVSTVHSVVNTNVNSIDLKEFENTFLILLFFFFFHSSLSGKSTHGLQTINIQNEYNISIFAIFSIYFTQLKTLWKRSD